MITLVLADDHQVMRQGLRSLLEREPDFKVVGEASSGLEASQLVERLNPDVLVLDLMMPDMNGLEVTRQVKKRSRTTHIVVLSMHRNERYVIEVLRAGAGAYVLKESSADDLSHAIRAVMNNQRYLSPPLSEMAIDAYVHATDQPSSDPYDTLTTREREVLHMAAQGLNNAAIGEYLHISQRTVEVHRSNIMRKLNLANQTDLIRYALKRGILPMEQ